MKRKSKSVDVEVNYEEIETASELAESELSASVGGATSATDGLSHLMKKASAGQVQTQENFLMQHVEQYIGGDHYDGQSEEPIVQSAVSHLDEELSSKGEVLTEKGMETFVHNLDSQINSSFGTQLESGHAAEIGKEWTKFVETGDHLDYATATGGVAEQEAQVRSIEKSMDALVAGQPDAKALEGDVHGYAQTLLRTLESNGEVLTQTGLEHSLENSSMSNLAGQISWSNIVAETSVQETHNHQTVADIEKSVYSDLQSVADNWQAPALSGIAGLNQQTINSEVQQAIHQFEADGHVLSQKDAQSIISSVESQDGITLASHVESVTNQVISDYQTAAPYMQNSHMTGSGIENEVLAAYEQAGSANSHTDASVIANVEQALGVSATAAAVSNSSAIANEITSDKLSVADGNLHQYIQAMEDKALQGVAGLSSSDQAAAKAQVEKYGTAIENQIESAISAAGASGNASGATIDGKSEVQNLEKSMLSELQSQYESTVQQQQSSIHNASELNQALSADKSELSIASMEVRADASALSNALGNGQALTEHGAAAFMQDVAQQIASNSTFREAQNTIENLTHQNSRITDSLVSAANKLDESSTTSKLSDAMDLEATLAAYANDPLLADKDNVHLGKDGGFSQAQLAAMQNDPELQKELGVTVNVDDGGYGGAQWMEDMGVWMVNHKAASAGIMAGAAVLTYGVGAGLTLCGDSTLVEADVSLETALSPMQASTSIVAAAASNIVEGTILMGSSYLFAGESIAFGAMRAHDS